MNFYVRYFDRETLVESIDDALSFLAAIPEITVDDDMEADLRAYAAHDQCYPKRYKVRPRIYFIIIKTTAATLADFKQKKESHAPAVAHGERPAAAPTNKMATLMTIQDGWYEGQLDFKRMAQKPQTNKYEYRDTHVVYRCKAISGMDCYNRIVDYLKTRVNSRSQFPSAKGNSFHFTYLGKSK